MYFLGFVYGLLWGGKKVGGRPLTTDEAAQRLTNRAAYAVASEMLAEVGEDVLRNTLKSMEENRKTEGYSDYTTMVEVWVASRRNRQESVKEFWGEKKKRDKERVAEVGRKAEARDRWNVKRGEEQAEWERLSMAEMLIKTAEVEKKVRKSEEVK